MMKNIFLINEDEKKRIINLHETATKRQYLSEQVKRGQEGDPYEYKKVGNQYMFRKVGEGETQWKTAKSSKSIESIRKNIFGEKQLNLTDRDSTSVDTTKMDKRRLLPKKDGVTLYGKINPSVKPLIKTNKISSTNSVPFFRYSKPDCAQFVNDFDDGRGTIGDAWSSHDIDASGNRVWSSFTNMGSDKVNKVINLWKTIDKSGGGVDNGKYTEQVKSLVNSLVPSSPSTSLKLGDVVGIFYPGSKHHESAFYDAGKPYFEKGFLGGDSKAGKNIKNGKGWGMNTHVGIVGAIKDGTPIIFHNIGGQVYADPFNNLVGGSKIAWVKRV
jgi:hypothetical protein